jgi:drug/metabolite transporter (DMT)-like permease
MTEGNEMRAAAPSAPAGWYPDPDQVQTQRFWDGTNWTDQRAPLTEGSTRSDDDYINVEVTPAIVGVIAGIIVTIVAVFLPFVDTKGVPVGSNTLIQNTEGVVLLILAVTALLTLYRRLTGARWWWATAAIGLVMIAVVIYTATNLPELSVGSNPFLEQETIKLSAGVGIYLAGLGAFLVTLGGFGLPRSRRRD